MSWSKQGGGPRGYHHGNLKETLIRAALELIAKKGPAGFTFAEAARWAGVSPGSTVPALSRPRRTHVRCRRVAASSCSKRR